MKFIPLRSFDARRERRTRTLLTTGFIVASAILHFVLASSVHGGSTSHETKQRARPLIVAMLETPRPMPAPTPPPTPRPAPAKRHLSRTAQRVPAKSSAFKHVSQRHTAPASASSYSQQAYAPAPSSPVPLETPAQPLASPTPLDARDIIIDARFVHRAEPSYPETALARGAEGTAIVLVTVDPDGSARDIRIWNSSGNAELDRAALAAANQSTYAPPQVDGQPATQTYRIIYTFYVNP